MIRKARLINKSIVLYVHNSLYNDLHTYDAMKYDWVKNSKKHLHSDFDASSVNKSLGNIIMHK